MNGIALRIGRIVLAGIAGLTGACSSDGSSPKAGSTPTNQQVSQDDWYRVMNPEAPGAANTNHTGAASASDTGTASSAAPGANETARGLPRPGDSRQASTDFSESLWTIAIMTTTTAALPESQVPLQLSRVRTEGRLSEAFVKRDGDVIHFCYGRYAGPEDPSAKKDIERLRAMHIANGNPYHGAVLMPPLDRELVGGHPALSLAVSPEAQQEGALYTLEVAIYRRPDQLPPTRDDLVEFRRLAELAAQNLRGDGLPAFYSHGLNSSSVTVGVFGEDDFDTSQNPPYRSPTLLRLMEQFRHFSLNGEQMRVRLKDYPADDPRGWRLEPSRIVNLPTRAHAASSK